MYFQAFSDDHKNANFKDRGVKFTVLDHIIIQNNKKDSTALSSFKQLQNSSPKVEALSKILTFRPFLDDHKNFIFKDRGVKFIVLQNSIFLTMHPLLD